MEFDIQSYLNKLQGLDPMYYGIIGGVLLVCLIWIVFAVNRSTKKRRARAVAPQIELQHLQVAPLGKGVQIKLVNRGFPAIISDVTLPKRHDLKITQSFKNYKLDTEKNYTIFLEADGSGRADDGFDILLEYSDQLDNIYRQMLHIEPKFNVVEPAKVKKYA